MVVQGLDSNWAPGPSHQGRNQSAVVVPLVGQLGVRLERVALEMVTKGAGLVGGIRGSGPDCAAGQTGVYVGHCWGTAKKRR